MWLERRPTQGLGHLAEVWLLSQLSRSPEEKYRLLESDLTGLQLSSASYNSVVLATSLKFCFCFFTFKIGQIICIDL